jgi:ABC-type Zn2+ transport system substrate-binding protein/surface adhesin
MLAGFVSFGDASSSVRSLLLPSGRSVHDYRRRAVRARRDDHVSLFNWSGRAPCEHSHGRGEPVDGAGLVGRVVPAQQHGHEDNRPRSDDHQQDDRAHDHER